MRKPKGFTLVEAAVAIAVVAILSGIIIPMIIKSIRDARNARARNDIHVIVAAIAAQLKDTGSRRPNTNQGPNGADGAGDAIWYSAGDIPTLDNAGAALALPAPGGNRFLNLFGMPSIAGNAASNAANALFGFDPWAGGREFQYRGPYLTNQVIMTPDPWGYAYIIVGYNENGMNAANGQGGHIWVVSAGESHRINAANLGPNPGVAPTAPAVWQYAGVSATNIAVQVH
jgi:prepilin-type N-terminal cleavage/methylation domain-containing protein